jgi:hypothetical protein
MSGMMKPLKTFEDVEAMLRHWVSFADPQLYDAGGMVSLFAACLDNMRLRMLEAELEDIDSYLTDEQKEFLLKLATMVRRAQSPG